MFDFGEASREYSPLKWKVSHVIGRHFLRFLLNVALSSG